MNMGAFLVVWAVPCVVTIAGGLILWRLGIRRGYHQAQVDTVDVERDAYKRGYQACAADLIRVVNDHERVQKQRAAARAGMQ